MLYLQ